MDPVQEVQLIQVLKEFLQEIKKHNRIELAKLYFNAEKQWTNGQNTVNQYLEILKDW